MSGVYIHTIPVMGTVVTFQVVGFGASEVERAERAAAVERAAAWFREIESCCSRFDAQSELRRLTGRVGDAVPVSATLFEALQFALAVAEESGGAFDPTIGAQMEQRGFNRNYRTELDSSSGIAAGANVSWRDIELDSDARTVTLTKPLVVDLGAVAKGLAVDMAARELEPFENFGVDAGGDLYLGGHNADGAPWSVGIRHPRDENAIVETMPISNSAVCTSGDYERRGATNVRDHHIMDARSGATAGELASVTVVAPSAMVADALATAAFALGPVEGLRFLERHEVRGLMITPSLERIDTHGALR